MGNKHINTSDSINRNIIISDNYNNNSSSSNKKQNKEAAKLKKKEYSIESIDQHNEQAIISVKKRSKSLFALRHYPKIEVKIYNKLMPFDYNETKYADNYFHKKDNNLDDSEDNDNNKFNFISLTKKTKYFKLSNFDISDKYYNNRNTNNNDFSDNDYDADTDNFHIKKDLKYYKTKITALKRMQESNIICEKPNIKMLDFNIDDCIFLSPIQVKKDMSVYEAFITKHNKNIIIKKIDNLLASNVVFRNIDLYNKLISYIHHPNLVIYKKILLNETNIGIANNDDSQGIYLVMENNNLKSFDKGNIKYYLKIKNINDENKNNFYMNYLNYLDYNDDEDEEAYFNENKLAVILYQLLSIVNYLINVFYKDKGKRLREAVFKDFDKKNVNVELNEEILLSLISFIDLSPSNILYNPETIEIKLINYLSIFRFNPIEYRADIQKENIYAYSKAKNHYYKKLFEVNKETNKENNKENYNNQTNKSIFIDILLRSCLKQIHYLITYLLDKNKEIKEKLTYKRLLFMKEQELGNSIEDLNDDEFSSNDEDMEKYNLDRRTGVLNVDNDNISMMDHIVIKEDMNEERDESIMHTGNFKKKDSTNKKEVFRRTNFSFKMKAVENENYDNEINEVKKKLEDEFNSDKESNLNKNNFSINKDIKPDTNDNFKLSDLSITSSENEENNDGNIDENIELNKNNNNLRIKNKTDLEQIYTEDLYKQNFVYNNYNKHKNSDNNNNLHYTVSIIQQANKNAKTLKIIKNKNKKLQRELKILGFSKESIDFILLLNNETYIPFSDNNSGFLNNTNNISRNSLNLNNRNNSVFNDNLEIIKTMTSTSNITFKSALSLLDINQLLNHKWFHLPQIRNSLCSIPYFYAKLKKDFVDSLRSFNNKINLVFIKLFSNYLYWMNSIIDTRMIFGKYFINRNSEKLELDKNDFIIGVNNILNSFSQEESQRYGFDVVDSGSISMTFDKIKNYFNKQTLNQDDFEIVSLCRASQEELNILNFYNEMLNKQKFIYKIKIEELTSTDFLKSTKYQEELYTEFLLYELKSIGKLSGDIEFKINNLSNDGFVSFSIIKEIFFVNK